MKKKIKPIVFTVLLVTFLVLLLLPVKVPAVTYLLGFRLGNDCWCPMLYLYDCLCVLPK